MLSLRPCLNKSNESEINKVQLTLTCIKICKLEKGHVEAQVIINAIHSSNLTFSPLILDYVGYEFYIIMISTKNESNPVTQNALT